jgi:hypothetical protein
MFRNMSNFTKEELVKIANEWKALRESEKRIDYEKYRNPKIKRWASEPISIKYRNPVANLEYCKKNGLDTKDPRNWKISNYHTDFWIEVLGDDGSIKKIFIEIKPYNQTQPPKPIPANAKLKEQRRYAREASTYLVNKAKWVAAKEYFAKRGCEFSVFTEKTLEKLGCL